MDHVDERRVILLKSQNAQLTKMNAYLNDVLKGQKKIMLEVDNVLNDLNVMFRQSEGEAFLDKIPRYR